MFALDGIRVADFTTFLSGAGITHLLSDMGADVIKIEPPDGDPWRSVSGGFMGTNRGKRAIAIDLKKEEAKEIIHKLIATADLLIENARPGAMQRLGLDYESVIKIKPDIIYISDPAHGSKGPYAKFPGFDPIIQSRSGEMVAQGGIGKPPVFYKVAVNDQAAPMLGAFGAVLALLVHAKTGKGQYVETSLTNSSVALQSGDFIDFKGIERRYLGDEDIKGLRATSRLYQGTDGVWFFVQCGNETHWRTLCQVLGLEKLLPDPRFESPEKRAENDAELTEILSESFFTTPGAQWVKILLDAGVPAALSRNLEDLLEDPHCLQTNMFVYQDHPQWGLCQILGVTPRFSEMEGVVRRPSPLLGEHTDEVLAELGYTEEQISEFKAKKVVFQSKPMVPLYERSEEELAQLGYTEEQIAKLKGKHSGR